MNGTVGKLARCAIYTRKSSEHNLDLAFTSLDAQREACEAYIKSQAHEGWRLIPDRYDDGASPDGNSLVGPHKARHGHVLIRQNGHDVHTCGVVPHKEGLASLLRVVAVEEVDDLGRDFLVHGFCGSDDCGCEDQAEEAGKARPHCLV